MAPQFDSIAETILALRARAARCRAMSRVAPLPFAAGMLERLAEQFEGEAARLAASVLPPAPRISAASAALGKAVG